MFFWGTRCRGMVLFFWFACGFVGCHVFRDHFLHCFYCCGYWLFGRGEGWLAVHLACRSARCGGIFLVSVLFVFCVWSCFLVCLGFGGGVDWSVPLLLLLVGMNAGLSGGARDIFAGRFCSAPALALVCLFFWASGCVRSVVVGRIASGGWCFRVWIARVVFHGLLCCLTALVAGFFLRVGRIGVGAGGSACLLDLGRVAFCGWWVFAFASGSVVCLCAVVCVVLSRALSGVVFDLA
ncbi:hypothetical protein SK79_01227 [Escherichia coli]|nr:hypothetical protein SK79_01227 [Escherichia coli]